jgi:hypothetical protein
MEYPPFSPDLALNVSRNKVCLKGMKSQDTEDIQKVCDDGYSTTEVPTVEALLC